MATPVPDWDWGGGPGGFLRHQETDPLPRTIPFILKNLLKIKRKSKNLPKSMAGGKNRNMHYYVSNIYIKIINFRMHL